MTGTTPDPSARPAPEQPPPATGEPQVALASPGGPMDPAAHAQRRRVWPAVWGAVAAMVIVLGLLAGDWAVRTYEMSLLLNRIEASEAAMVATQQQMRSVDVPDNPGDAQRERAGEILQSIAARGSDAVASAGDEVAGVSFLPWHSPLIDAQASYLAHNEAWVDYLERGAKDVTVLLSDDSAIESTWSSAEHRVRDAMPTPAWAPLSDRVERIFTDQPADDSGDEPGDDDPRDNGGDDGLTARGAPSARPKSARRRPLPAVGDARRPAAADQWSPCRSPGRR